jgi:hypothetical protein
LITTHLLFDTNGVENSSSQNNSTRIKVLFINELYPISILQIGTIYETGEPHSYDIIPVLVPKEKKFRNRKRSNYLTMPTHEQYHMIYKRNVKNYPYGEDFMIFNSRFSIT